MVFKNTYSTSQAVAFVEVGWLGIPTLGSRNKTYLIVVLVSFIKRCEYSRASCIMAGDAETHLEAAIW